jgi:hypothetical protein
MVRSRGRLIFISILLLWVLPFTCNGADGKGKEKKSTSTSTSTTKAKKDRDNSLYENAFYTFKEVSFPSFIPPYRGMIDDTLGLLRNSSKQVVDISKGGDPKAVAESVKVTVADKLVNQPVFVSIAAISQRIGSVYDSVKAVFQGSVIPTRVFVFISAEPYLMDEGVPITGIPRPLLDMTSNYPVSIVYTDNIGPHRKLIPLLWKHWHDDVVIITIDDDFDSKKYPDVLANLIKYYIASDREHVVALRARRIGLCRASPYGMLRYSFWSIMYHYGTVEMLVLPTGTGGILYRPRFFDPIVFDPILRNRTATGDDIMFRIAAMLNDVSVVVACYPQFRNGEFRKCPSKAKMTSLPPGNFTHYHHALSANANGRAHARRLEDEPDSDDEEKMQDALALALANGKGKLGGDFVPVTIDKDKGEDEGSLWSINKLVKNNAQWSKALAYVKAVRKFQFRDLADKYIRKERGNECFKGNKPPFACSLVKCGGDKSGGKPSGKNSPKSTKKVEKNGN